MSTQDAAASANMGEDSRGPAAAVLSDDAATGLMLTERLAERSKDAWRPSAVAVYPVLSQLVDEGMATVEIRDGRPMYTATEAGHTEARRLVIERGRTPWPTPVEVQSRQLMRAVGAFTLATRQFAASGTAAQIASAIDIVHDAQRRLFSVLAGEESPDR